MEDKELKKELEKIPDLDKNGDPIYKIDDASKKKADLEEAKNAEVNEGGIPSGK